MLSDIEQSRLAISKATDPKKKSRLGQFFTPATIGRFMAGLFTTNSHSHCRLLDPGAGIGSLCGTFLDRWVSGDLKFKDVHLDAFEIDPFLQPYLMQTLEKYENISGFSMDIDISDFIFAASEGISGTLFVKPISRYTHAILNPPYKKIRSDSKHRSALRRAGIETVNLYSAFLALSLSLLKPRGQLVAIVPRSFCNGPYYRRFRKSLLTQSAIRQIHLFLSRSKAFKDDDVLQENIILHLEKNGKKGPIKISTSTDDRFYDLTSQNYPVEKIVLPDDPEQFIHIPTSASVNSIFMGTKTSCTLSDLKINISTGPVVDFRVKEHLQKMPGPGTVPLLYPAHFTSKGSEWPKPDMKKPNAIHQNSETKKWLFPNDFYCVVRRFSSKEEKRRVMANVVNPINFPGMTLLGFENHLNVFHANKLGLPKTLAYGLMVFLNSTALDEYFRTFNGHTQVNATDLKQIKYPSREILVTLGEWALNQLELTQELIDEKLETIHQFVDAGIALYNPDKHDRPVNSPKAVYQIAPATLKLLQNFGTKKWHDNLTDYMAERETLIARYARERELNRVPVQIAPGKTITLSPGEHSELIRAVIEDFAPRFAPGSMLIYAGDTGDKWGYFDAAMLAVLNVDINSHGKMPDVVLHHVRKNWLLLVESVTSHGPMDGKRHSELTRLFAGAKAGLVYVTAFPNRVTMARYLDSIAWETEVWVADAPSHLIHFDGERFLGPYT